ncbi:hypothetical protein GCG54_00015016 [Colletotrichum gloeosporioides]|uniref:Uncharacterized protein n=1 Tax=Colletotrichum gloeosporioides TaxID=474922 RepID=A0A8H4FGY0_COLGL|nr:uncharacterized protein GCG54_00015016 [Colletotrichum gloeosporioides]KAF3801797.1 hypothetical protein GCG54_00015016 [Colletotrichum gloeosporioides]
MASEPKSPCEKAPSSRFPQYTAKNMQERRTQGPDPTQPKSIRTSLSVLRTTVTKLEIEANAYQEAIKKQDLLIEEAFNNLQDPSSGHPMRQTPSSIAKSSAKSWTASLEHLWDLYTERAALRTKLMKITEDKKTAERSVQALKSLTITNASKKAETPTGDAVAILASAMGDLTLQPVTIPKIEEAQKTPYDSKQQSNQITRSNCGNLGRSEAKLRQTTGPSTEKSRAAHGRYSIRIVEDNEPWKTYGYRGDNFYDHYDRIRALARKR